MNINFERMEEYAAIYNIPIMRKDAIEWIVDFIKDNNIKNTLEIGTAIGYSTLKIADAGSNITSIERDEERYKEAVKNVNDSNCKDKVNLIKADALEIDMEGLFDLIVIDAAKAQNIKFVEKYKHNLNKNGFIIIDNVDFHGLVGKSETIKSRNLRSLVRKIEEFLKYLDNQNEFKVTKIDKGDGLILLRGINE